MKSTPLTAKHQALGAKMAEFAGYNMPISYSTLSEEHRTVRTAVGLFDVSHMGEFIVRGSDALAFLQSITANDVSKLQPGEAQYTYLPNHDGGIVDDLLVYCLEENMANNAEPAYMLVVNASNEEKDWNWLQQHVADFSVNMLNISDQTGLLALQGPLAARVLGQLTDLDLNSIAYYSFRRGTVAGFPNVIVSATGYTGAGGFELYANNKHLEPLWDALLQAGEAFGIRPCGLGARDTLRLEMGYCLYGNDLTDTTNPLEAGLGWVTKLNKGTDFPSADRLRAQKAGGVSRKLVGFTLTERRVPRHGYPIESTDGRLIGEVSSGTHSPTLDQPIGMGYIETASAKPGNTVMIVIGSKKLPATVCKTPFVG
jgi:aminomethyltransferase